MPSDLQPGRRVRWTLFVWTAAVLLPALPGRGAVFLEVGDRLLADRASLIVTARVLGREAAGARPATGYRLEVEEVVQGTPPADLVVWFPGGVRNGLALEIPGVPRFEAGDSVLLFLKVAEDGRYLPSHLFLSAFDVLDSAHGKVAVRAAAGRAAPPKVRDLDRFLAWLADRDRPQDYFLPDAAAGTASHGKFESIVSSTDPPPFGCGENGGHPVRWFDFDPPAGAESGGAVGWHVHFGGQDGLGNGGLASIRAGLDAWSGDPHSEVELDFLGLTSASGGLAAADGVNAVLAGDPGELMPGTVEDTGILAVGGPWFRCAPIEHDGELFHPVVEGDVVTNQGLDRFLAASSSPRRTAEEILAHELGHALGFAHSDDAEALMYATAHADGRGAALGVDDLRGLHEIYGDGELEPPAAPSDVVLTAGGATAVEIAWSDNSADESNFRLERDGGDGFAPIATVPADERTFRDTRVAPESGYRYRVRAQNGAGASEYSAEAAVTTPPDLRPAPPSNLRAAPLSSTRIRLTWQDNSDDEDAFAIFLLEEHTSTFVEVPFAVPSGTSAVLLSELDPATRYTFRVGARNAFGTSPLSNPAQAATFAPDAPCRVDAGRLCLLEGRFQAEVFFTDPADGSEARATTVPSTDQTGMFWFFDAGNIELIVKVLDGRAVNGYFWVFFGGVSDLEYRLKVTDTATGESVTYENSRGELCGRADTSAFEAGDPPASAQADRPWRGDPAGLGILPLGTSGRSAGDRVKSAAACEPRPDRLCLAGGRLAIDVAWKNPWDGSEGDGRAVYGSDNSGYFWFFGPQNLELVVKALDGTPINGHLWLFYGALTDLEYRLTATDTVTGAKREYDNPSGRICGQADILAFETLTPPP